MSTRPISALLSSKEKWCKHTYTRVQFNGELSYCLVGALHEAFSRKSPAAFSDNFNKLHDAVRVLFPNLSFSVANFNDNKATTFEDVQKVLDYAKL